MRKSNPRTKTAQSNIQCLEVLIPKRLIVNSGHNLHWTLSVYSLQNQPVQKSRSIHNSEIFHFMVYDWKRTIKQLLEDLQVPYTIIQYFSPETIYSDPTQINSAKLFSPLDSKSVSAEETDRRAGENFSGQSALDADLILEEKTH